MKDEWVRCTQNFRCPLCGSDGKCQVAKGDPDCVMCSKLDEAPSGWFEIKKCLNAEPPAIIYRKGEKRAKRGPLFESLQRKFQNDLPAHIDLLEEQLQLPIEIIKKCQYGWCEKHEGKTVRAFTCPEKDASGRIVGFSLRYPRPGTKKPMLKLADRAKKTGLFWLGDLVKMPDPVLIVEGMSDVAACLWLGVAAVGRHSNTSGEKDLIALLRDRNVIVIGELDPKQTGKWPGQEGAKKIAGKLSQAWGKARVSWSMSPDMSKDIRSWVIARAHGDEDLKALGQQMVAQIREFSNDVVGYAGGEEDTERPKVGNIIDHWNDEDKYKPLVVPVNDIKNRLQTITEGWPRRVGGMLFVANGHHMEEGDLPGREAWRPLKNTQELFAWMHEVSRPRWFEGGCVDPDTNEYLDPATKSEFFSSCGATLMPNYETVETLPHYPKCPDAHYCECPLPKSDGSAMKEFLDHMNPATEEDRCLIQALMLTLGWGGEPGHRPAFVFTSDWGTGAGKTRTATFIVNIWGGAPTVGEFEEWETVRSRLLSDSALKQRALIIDNIRGKMARSGIESMITGNTIDGKKMYYGQFARPNYITMIMTANTPSLSKDLAERAIVIGIGEPKHANSADFEEWASDFMKNRRAALISDVIEQLRNGPVCNVDKNRRDRWGTWIDGVLRTIPNANALLDFIHEGRLGVDQDLIDSQKVVEVIAGIMKRMGLNIAYDKMRIKKSDFRQWLMDCSVIDNNLKAKGCTTWLQRLMKLEPLRPLTEDPGHSGGRRWLWTGPGADADTQVYDYIFEQHGGADAPDRQIGGGGDASRDTTDYSPPPDNDETELY